MYIVTCIKGGSVSINIQDMKIAPCMHDGMIHFVYISKSIQQVASGMCYCDGLEFSSS